LKSDMHPGPLEWRRAQVREVLVETSRVRSLVVHVDGWPGHLPGQYVNVRAFSNEGSQPHRSYSIASAPEDGLLTLTVERIGGGGLSTYLVDQLQRGDSFELHGPIGRSLVWTAASDGPVTLLAGGLGIAPLMAMLRHRQRHHCPTHVVLLYSAKCVEDIVFREELNWMARSDPHLRVNYTLTRSQPVEWSGYAGRINRELLAETCFPCEQNPRHFICGPLPFVQQVSTLLLELGHGRSSIHT